MNYTIQEMLNVSMDHEDKKDERWVDIGGDLVEAYRDLITIRIVEHTSKGASVSIVGLVSLVIAMFVLLFAGFGTAWWLGEYLQDMKTGFFIVGGIYTVIFIVLLLMAKKLLVPRVRNLIIKKIYEQD
jgi:hypothetical protein